MRNGQKLTRRRWRRGCCASAPSRKTSRSACTTCPASQTYVDATHAARALQTADKALASLPKEPLEKDVNNAASSLPVYGVEFTQGPGGALGERGGPRSGGRGETAPTCRDDRLPSDPDFRIETINCIPLPGEEDRDIWEIIAATQDEQQDFDIAVDCGWRPDGARYDPKDRFYNCPRLQHWIQTYGMDYFTHEPPWGACQVALYSAFIPLYDPAPCP